MCCLLMRREKRVDMACSCILPRATPTLIENAVGVCLGRNVGSFPCSHSLLQSPASSICYLWWPFSFFLLCWLCGSICKLPSLSSVAPSKPPSIPGWRSLLATHISWPAFKLGQEDWKRDDWPQSSLKRFSLLLPVFWKGNWDIFSQF